MTTEILLGIITFFTSIVAGVVGMGGGLILIAILPMYLPVNAIIPVHGVTQMSSNISRAIFGWNDIQFDVVKKFFIGSCFGVLSFAGLLYIISLTYLPLFIGFYILLSLWSSKFNEMIKHYESYYAIGFLQSGIALFVGATGPLSITLLYKDFHERDKVVATAALFMSITHTFKVATFIFFGFVFKEYWALLACMVTGAIAGSYAGTKLRHLLDGKRFLFALKVLITMLAIRVIIGVFV